MCMTPVHLYPPKMSMYRERRSYPPLHAHPYHQSLLMDHLCVSHQTSWLSSWTMCISSNWDIRLSVLFVVSIVIEDLTRNTKCLIPFTCNGWDQKMKKKSTDWISLTKIRWSPSGFLTFKFTIQQTNLMS